MTAFVQAVSRISKSASNVGITWRVLTITSLVISLIFVIGGADFPPFAP